MGDWWAVRSVGEASMGCRPWDVMVQQEALGLGLGGRDILSREGQLRGAVLGQGIYGGKPSGETFKGEREAWVQRASGGFRRV